MEVCKKEHKKFKKIINKNEVNLDSKVTEEIPIWFDKNQEKEENGLDELNDVLKEFE